MSASTPFSNYTRELAKCVAARDGLSGLVLLGSAADSAEHRRDEWSDHDFFAIAAAGRGQGIRDRLDWLPFPERIVLTAREGEIGFVAVYDDGHVFEFAAAEASELSGAIANDASVVLDDDEGTTAALIAQSRARAEASDRFDPENDARLVLVKLLIGVGRVRRGEVLAGGQFIRTWAVNHVVRALRGRRRSASYARDAIDPLRRLEADEPVAAARIAAALDQPLERAARDLFALTRELLEPGWEGFPSEAADAVAHRLGWPHGHRAR